MRTTIDLPDDLFRRAKAEAALHGLKLRDFFEEGLRRVLATPFSKGQKLTLESLMSKHKGIVNSGLSDLGSNPNHLEELGRDSLGHR